MIAAKVGRGPYSSEPAKLGSGIGLDVAFEVKRNAVANVKTYMDGKLVDRSRHVSRSHDTVESFLQNLRQGIDHLVYLEANKD
jgi:hypothetical protein